MKTLAPSTIAIYAFRLLVLVGLITLLINGCEPEPRLTVTTPEIKKTLPKVTQVQIVHDTVYIPKGTKTIVKNHYIKNDSLQVYKDELDFAVDRYNYETDSLKKLLMFQDAIALKSFTTNLEDEYLKLEINGIISGTLKEITPTYTIKPQKIDLKPQKSVTFRLLGGGGFGVNTDFNNVAYKVNLGFQNKAGNVFVGGYAKINENNFVLIDFCLPLLSIKR